MPSQTLRKKKRYVSPFPASVDILTLKKLRSIGWAIIALIFCLVIPGIMLLVADGPIKSLDERGNGVGAGSQSAVSDPMEKITKLKSLLDSGAITQQEFDEQKKKLL